MQLISFSPRSTHPGTCRDRGLGGVIIADTVGFIVTSARWSGFSSHTRRDTERIATHTCHRRCGRRSRVFEVEVESVLEEIGAGDIPQLIVYNKIDLLEREPKITRDSDGRPDTVSVSAKTGAARLCECDW